MLHAREIHLLARNGPKCMRMTSEMSFARGETTVMEFPQCQSIALNIPNVNRVLFTCEKDVGAAREN